MICPHKLSFDRSGTWLLKLASACSSKERDRIPAIEGTATGEIKLDGQTGRPWRGRTPLPVLELLLAQRAANAGEATRNDMLQ